jgi:hypothetical protein
MGSRNEFEMMAEYGHIRKELAELVKYAHEKDLREVKEVFIKYNNLLRRKEILELKLWSIQWSRKNGQYDTINRQKEKTSIISYFLSIKSRYRCFNYSKLKNE